MWVIQYDHQGKEGGVLETAAEDRPSTEVVMTEFIEKWVTEHKLNLDHIHVHMCTGEDHGHAPYAVVAEFEDGAEEPKEVLLELHAFQLTGVVSQQRPLDVLRKLFEAALKQPDEAGAPSNETLH